MKYLKKATCKKCGYSWDTKSDMVFASCPSCNNKVRIRELKKTD